MRHVRYERIEVYSLSHEVNIPFDCEHVLAFEPVAPSGFNAPISLQEKDRTWPSPSLTQTLADERVVAVPAVGVNLGRRETLR